MDNLPEFSLDYDMKPLYKLLCQRFPKGFPEFLVFNDLPGGESILHRCFPDGRRVYFVKEDSAEVIINTLSNEFDNPQSRLEDSIPITYHALSDYDVSKWLMYACFISDILSIGLRQICFTHKEGGSGFSEEFITFIDDDVNDIEMIMVIAHELRHAWQHKTHPDWFEDYIHPEDDKYEYQIQLSEVDAEAFAIKVESLITGVEFINSKAGFELDPYYRQKLIDRMNQIDVIISKKDIKYIRNLLDIEGIINSVSHK